MMSGVQRRPFGQFPLHAGPVCWSQSSTGGAQ
jgi:hypothetical protein